MDIFSDQKYITASSLERAIWRHNFVIGPVRESNPGPLAPKARIMPLDQQAFPGIWLCEWKSNYDDDGYQSISEKLIKRLIPWNGFP